MSESVSLDIDLSQVRPYYDSLGDGMVQLSFTLPIAAGKSADQAARKLLQGMNLTDISLVEKKAIAPEFTFFVAYAKTTFSVDLEELMSRAEEESSLDYSAIVELARSRIDHRLVVVGATLESDAHTVGLDAIFNMKGFAGHYGLENYPCFKTFNLGAQVPFHTLIEVLHAQHADAVLISQTITQKGLHLKNLTRLVDLLEAEGLRSRVILVVGGPNITPELAKELGYDQGFGRGTLPEAVATFVVREYLRRSNV